MKAFNILANFFCVLIFSTNVYGQIARGKTTDKAEVWFPKYNFNLKSFDQPAPEFAPFARWWWPGNNVNKDELKREVNLFADNHFGGVEIQPFNLFVPGSKDTLAKVLSFDTPDYYANVIAVMEEARKRHLTVDMTDGSGWPPGGPHLSIQDGFWTLQFANVDIAGDSSIFIALPTIMNTTGVPSRLEAVLACKAIPKNKEDKTQTIILDPLSTIVLTKNVKNDSLHWKVPAGKWKLIAFWSKPSGEMGMTATPVQGPVVDHFNTSKVLKSYNYLFGARTGLAPYFGNPMRSIFNDSYEFAVDRHFSQDFAATFKKNRGYDVAPWLPAEMQKRYNYVSFRRGNADPDFSFSKEDWRLKFDYDLTLSELLGEHFFKTSKNWMEPKGLLHRTQAYGLNMDMIAQAGLASIPETESMNGPEANLKIVTSGAHLYNRPIASAESVVFTNRAYTTTPQKTKIAVDKLFAAGVNQIIYHGVPYRYTPPELGPEGWNPFSTPVTSAVNFSSNFGEGNIFWKHQKEMNDYISRTQYALRSGKPHADVIIYFPFMNVEGMPDNPEEILTNGYLEKIEGPLPTNKEKKNEDKEQWAKSVYPIINQLEASGITWDWVNDISIQEAILTNNNQINIRGNTYQALILANDSIIQLKTARAIKRLAVKGMNFIATGVLPHRQPSYLNWKENDAKTAQLIAAALNGRNSKYLNDENDLSKWINGLYKPIAFNGQFHFTRQVQRDMNDGSRIQFVWNKSDQWQTLSLVVDKKYSSSYWMNAGEGTITENKASVVTYQMPPYGTAILYAAIKNNKMDKKLAVSPVVTDIQKEVLNVKEWNLKADSIEIKNTLLFDWRTNEHLKFSSAEGIYTSSFQWNNSDSASHFYLDLGKVYFTAELYVNEKLVGTRIFAPYTFDITSFLVPGPNKIEVRVTTGQLNGFIGKAKLGDNRYKQFKNKEDQLMAAGLSGPVVIMAAVH